MSAVGMEIDQVLRMLMAKCWKLWMVGIKQFLVGIQTQGAGNVDRLSATDFGVGLEGGADHPVEGEENDHEEEAQGDGKRMNWRQVSQRRPGAR